MDDPDWHETVGAFACPIHGRDIGPGGLSSLTATPPRWARRPSTRSTSTDVPVVSGIIGLVVDETRDFRIDEEHELSGIDLVVRAETAHDLHATAGARSGPGILGGSAASREEPR